MGWGGEGPKPLRLGGARGARGEILGGDSLGAKLAFAEAPAPVLNHDSVAGGVDHGGRNFIVQPNLVLVVELDGHLRLSLVDVPLSHTLQKSARGMLQEDALSNAPCPFSCL